MRYAGDPKTLWGWYEPYIKDEEVCTIYPLRLYLFELCDYSANKKERHTLTSNIGWRCDVFVLKQIPIEAALYLV